jgi:hypothetical protein
MDPHTIETYRQRLLVLQQQEEAVYSPTGWLLVNTTKVCA